MIILNVLGILITLRARRRDKRRLQRRLQTAGRPRRLKSEQGKAGREKLVTDHSSAADTTAIPGLLQASDRSHDQVRAQDILKVDVLDVPPQMTASAVHRGHHKWRPTTCTAAAASSMQH
ncbi:hypothetical protein E4U43_003649 [Claviceps pusilla]|uniref:Uncharacterized protein n=1 Tax=Claviceps pusilla TaxID=123648 RepID=A0A9P7NHU5_9HYPO|nr:hypothetical protein E4U43_003649 [Claviceps pusilla]